MGIMGALIHALDYSYFTCVCHRRHHSLEFGAKAYMVSAVQNRAWACREDLAVWGRRLQRGPGYSPCSGFGEQSPPKLRAL